jgi:hypothetical protein
VARPKRSIRHKRSKTIRKNNHPKNSPKTHSGKKHGLPKLRRPRHPRSLRNFIKTYKPQKALIITKSFWGQEKIENTSILFVPAHYL